MAERQEIANLVDALDHPDERERRSAMRRLVDLGAQAVEVLNANLTLAEPDTRPALIRVLGEIGDTRSLLPLMRYVFDTQDEIEEGDARGLAMQAIMRIADPSQAEKVFQFLLDIKEDDDAFVRGYAIEAFGKLGDERAAPFVEEALDDRDDFVRECAQRAKEALENAEGDSLRSTLDGRELLNKIRISSGSELEYYVNELLDRDDAFELALKLIREEAFDRTRGLRALQRLDDPRARDVAVRQFAASQSDAARAICLRILAKHLEGDATDEEVELIRKALHHSDAFVSLAALEASGKTGDRQLVKKCLQAAQGTDLSKAETAAESLSRGLTSDQTQLLPDLVDAIERIHRHRRNDSDPEYVYIEAYLLRTLRRVVADGGMGVSEAQHAALNSLEEAGPHRPILVTALELLDATLPESGAEGTDRWSAPEALPLVELLEHSDDAVARRALDIVHRGVAGELHELSDKLSRLIYEDAAIVREHVIPMLERSADKRARQLLDELTDHRDAGVADDAEAALRRLRNSGTTLDADLE